MKKYVQRDTQKHTQTQVLVIKVPGGHHRLTLRHHNHTCLKNRTRGHTYRPTHSHIPTDTDKHTRAHICIIEVPGDSQKPPPPTYTYPHAQKHKETHAHRPLTHVHTEYVDKHGHMGHTQGCTHTKVHTSITEVPGEISLGPG